MERQFIKGQRYNLLSRWENLTQRPTPLDSKAAPHQQTLAHGLPTQGIVWPTLGLSPEVGLASSSNDGRTLKWQRLYPFEKFAWLVEGTGPASSRTAYPGNKVALGFVEGFNNKIRVIQQRAYSYRDEEYLRLKLIIKSNSSKQFVMARNMRCFIGIAIMGYPLHPRATDVP